jgi:hypothetical protein
MRPPERMQAANRDVSVMALNLQLARQKLKPCAVSERRNSVGKGRRTYAASTRRDSLRVSSGGRFVESMNEKSRNLQTLADELETTP